VSMSTVPELLRDSAAPIQFYEEEGHSTGAPPLPNIEKNEWSAISSKPFGGKPKKDNLPLGRFFGSLSKHHRIILKRKFC